MNRICSFLIASLVLASTSSAGFADCAQSFKSERHRRVVSLNYEYSIQDNLHLKMMDRVAAMGLVIGEARAKFEEYLSQFDSNDYEIITSKHESGYPSTLTIEATPEILSKLETSADRPDIVRKVEPLFDLD